MSSSSENEGMLQVEVSPVRERTLGAAPSEIAMGASWRGVSRAENSA